MSGAAPGTGARQVPGNSRAPGAPAAAAHSPSSQSGITSPDLYSIIVCEGPCGGTGSSAKPDMRCRGQKGAVGSDNSREPAEAEPKPGRAPGTPSRPRHGPYRRSSRRGRACSPRGRQRGQARSRSRPARARPAPAAPPSPAWPRAATAAASAALHGPTGNASRQRRGRPAAMLGAGRTAAPRLHILRRSPRLPQSRKPGRPPPLVPPRTPGPSWRPVWPSPPGLARARSKPLCCRRRPRHGPAWRPAALSGAAESCVCR